jgi:hypothetical protein
MKSFSKGNFSRAWLALLKLPLLKDFIEWLALLKLPLLKDFIEWLVRSVLLVEKTRGPGENHRPVASHLQSLSHNVVHLALIEILQPSYELSNLL